MADQGLANDMNTMVNNGAIPRHVAPVRAYIPPVDPHDANRIKGRMWCFTLHADEDAGEHVSWPLATVRDPPLHWADKAHFTYMMYQVTFFIVINGRLERVNVGRARARDREDSSTRFHSIQQGGAVTLDQEEHLRACALGAQPRDSRPEHRVLLQEGEPSSRSV